LVGKATDFQGSSLRNGEKSYVEFLF
jgi:hypothetical protein